MPRASPCFPNVSHGHTSWTRLVMIPYTNALKKPLGEPSRRTCSGQHTWRNVCWPAVLAGMPCHKGQFTGQPQEVACTEIWARYGSFWSIQSFQGSQKKLMHCSKTWSVVTTCPRETLYSCETSTHEILNGHRTRIAEVPRPFMLMLLGRTPSHVA